MRSISGIRGIVGETLTPEVVVRYSAAFAEYCKAHTPHPEIVLGRDGRSSGKVFANIISSTLLAAGANVRAIGIAPTPTVQLAVEHANAAGGIAVTASHNPMEWNGMKFIGPTGSFLDGDQNSALWKIAENGTRRYAPWNLLGTHSPDESWIQNHIDTVLNLTYIDRDAIRARTFRVVLDCVNASGGVIVPMLLEQLGCDVVCMHCDVSGVFAHLPEPIPENLTALATRVQEENADLGIAIDPDGDRLVLITEEGVPFGEEYTIASAVKFVLEREATINPGQSHTVVVNLSTTRAVDDIAHALGARVVRTPVGEINVVSRMRDLGAVIGGEGSGGVILPAIHLGRDAIVGTALLLQLLAESGGTLSELKVRLPHYAIAKGKITLGPISPDEVLHRIRQHHSGSGTVNTDDGLKLDFPDYWVHLRKSNTEPIVRVIAEARTSAQAEDVVQKFLQQIRTHSS